MLCQNLIPQSDPWKVSSIHQFCNQKYINRSIHHSISWLQTIYLFNDRTLIWKILRDESNDSTAKLAENVIETFHGFQKNQKVMLFGHCTCLVNLQHCRVHLTQGLTVTVQSLLFASRFLLCFFLRFSRVLCEGT